METNSLPIYNQEGKELETLKLNSSVFDSKINTAAIYQAVTAYTANHRVGLAQTKTRGEVSGGGRKPWKQKGTGRARVGSTRSPLWRHGGVIFGPHPRDYSYTLPQKIRNLALKSALSSKLMENNIIILDKLQIDEPKTAKAIKIFSALKIDPRKENSHFKVLLLLDKKDDQIRRALRNVSFLNINLARDTQAYEVLIHKKIIMTRKALEDITERLVSAQKKVKR